MASHHTQRQETREPANFRRQKNGAKCNDPDTENSFLLPRYKSGGTRKINAMQNSGKLQLHDRANLAKPQTHYDRRNSHISGYFLGDDGAGEGNRTLLRSLEGYCITTMLRPHSLSGSISSSHMQGNPPTINFRNFLSFHAFRASWHLTFLSLRYFFRLLRRVRVASLDSNSPLRICSEEE